MSRLSLIGLALAALLLGCGGGGGGGGAASGVAGPYDLVAWPGISPNEFSLSWRAPAQAVSGYELEGKGPGEEYRKLHEGLIPAGYTSLAMRLDVAPTEGFRLDFRLRASSNGQFSPYSNEATYQTEPDAPTGLTGNYDWGQGGVALSWIRNSVVSDGCRLERAASNAYGQATSTWSVLGGVASTTSTFLDTAVSKDSYYLYRVTNLKGALASTPAISPVVFTGIPKIGYLSADWDSVQSGAQLCWSWSTSTDSWKLRVRIERTEVDDSGSLSGAWTSVGTVDAPATCFLDPLSIENIHLLYRVTPFVDSNDGATITAAYPTQVPLKAPVNLRLTTTDKGICLDWENRSSAATEVVVRRSTSAYGGEYRDIALLSVSAATFEDTGMPVGYYTYHVVARQGSTEASSVPETAPTANPANALNLTAGALFPSLSCGAVRPEGGWVLGVGSPFGVHSDNDPWPPFFPSNASWWNPDFVRVDSKGYPHAVYAKSNASGAGQSTIVHAWFDGTEWKKEDVATTNFTRIAFNCGFEFTLDTGGNLHLLLDHSTGNFPYGGSTDTLTYVHKSGEAYVVEPLSAICSSTHDNVRVYRIQVDGQDRPHLLLGIWAAVLECTKDKDGAWNSATLPTGNVEVGHDDFLDARWVDPGNGWIFYCTRRGLEGTLMGLQRRGGAWQVPVAIANCFDGQNASAHVALSTDGARLVVHHHSTLGERLFHLTPEGWVGTLLGPTNLYGAGVIPMGFDAGQKFHILFPGNDRTQFQEYKEP